MILHIAVHNKFTGPLFKLMHGSVSWDEHMILSRARHNDWPSNIGPTVTNARGLKWAAAFFWRGYLADKIILHGLFDPRILLLLFLQPWLLKKCYWVVLGGDLYAYNATQKTLWWRFKELLRKVVIRHIGHLVTYIDGDVALAQSWYGAKGKQHRCLMYPSNIFQDVVIPHVQSGCLNVQVGNSADPSNEHLAAFEALAQQGEKAINVYAPLSYGEPAYAQSVVKAGRAAFGEHFFPLTEFMSFEQYLQFLASIDIAVFNHRRQQAMGNIITLLSLGVKVYMRRELSSWQVFEQYGIRIYDIDHLDLARLPADIAAMNSQKIREHFSAKALIEQWCTIFAH